MLDYRKHKLSVILNIWVNKCLDCATIATGEVEVKENIWVDVIRRHGSGGVRNQAGGGQVHQVNPGVETAERADHPQRGEADQSPENLGTKIQRSQPRETQGDRQGERKVETVK